MCAGSLRCRAGDNGVVHALDVKTGENIWGPRAAAQGQHRASPTLADGKIYVTSETQGVTSVFAAGPKFELLAENPTNEYTLSTIAVSDGQLFLRTDSHLYAIGKRKKP